MQALYHFPFLQALGYAIANSFWQVALIWLIVTVLHGVLKASSAAKYRIAVWAQFAGFAWFAVTFRFYFQRCVSAVREMEAFQLADNASFYITYTNTGFRNTLTGMLLKAEQLLPFLSVAYLCLLVFLAFKWAASYRQTQQIRYNGLLKTDINWSLFVQKVSAQLGIKNKVSIYLSTLVKSPLTIGFLKPIILIPIASVNHLSTEQMEAVILHELAHIRRADYLVNLLHSVVEIILFFNPFTRLLSSVIRKERENSCDDWVLQYQYNPAMYAEALLNIARLQQQPVLAMPAAGDKRDLLPRVKRMLNKQEKSFDYKRHLVALMLMTFVLSGAAWLVPSGSSTAVTAKSKEKQTKVQPVVIEPVSLAVNNPLFNPVFFLAEEKRVKPVGAAKSTVKVVNLQMAVTPRVEMQNEEVADTAKLTIVAVAASQPAIEQAETIGIPADEHRKLAGAPVITHAVATWSDKQEVIVTGRKMGLHRQRRMQYLPVFATFASAQARVRPPRLPEEEDTLRRVTGFRIPAAQPRLLMLQPVADMPRPTPPTAAIVLERFLQSGNDSLNQQVLVSIAHAKNNADSVNVLRRFYRELWQQSRKRREQAEASYTMQEKDHWAVFTPLVIERIHKSADKFSTAATDSVTTIVAGKEGPKQYRIIINTSVTMVKHKQAGKKAEHEKAADYKDEITADFAASESEQD